jgi:uncharacterized repeat protein (TIGR01451 family)
MKRLLTTSFLLTLIALSGCYNGERPIAAERTQAVAAKTQQTFLWHRDLGRIAVTPVELAPVGLEPELVAMGESGAHVVSMVYPSSDYATIQVDKVMPKEVQIDRQFTYTIKVTNLTHLALNDVIISEDLPSNFRFASAYPTARKEANKLIWTVDSLGPKASKQIDVTGMATDKEPLRHCTTVTQLSRSYADVEVVQPKLELTVSAPAEVLLCDPIALEFNVSNTGSGTARNVKIVYVLPVGLETLDGKKEVIFDAGILPTGQARQFSTRVRATKTGVYVNKALAGSASGLRSESAAIVTTVRQPKLTIVNTGPKRQYLGRSVTYEVVVTNKGDGAARDTVVEHTIPFGATSVEATASARLSGSKVVWELGTLAPDDSKQMRLSYTPIEPAALMNTATATAYCADGVTASVETSISGIPAVRLEVVDVEDPVEVGSGTTYVITASNEGTAADTNIRIVCDLEDKLQYVSAVGATSGSRVGNTVTFVPLQSLPPKASATWRVVVTGVKAGEVRFKVTMTSDNLVRAVEETVATRVYEKFGG